MEKRSLSVDIAKGISIIVIVFGHVGFSYPKGRLLDTEDLFIYLWHVPVFFILAGFFLKKDELVNPLVFIKKKFISLYVKILYFYILGVLLHNFFINIGWYSLDSIEPSIHVYTNFEFIKQLILAVCFAGREPLLGAMWFVYVLFMAFVGLSFLAYLIKNTRNENDDFEWLFFIVLLIMCIFSGIISNKYGLSIKRFSNVFTAMFLINLGRLLFQKAKLTYTNGYLLIICFLLTFEVACMLGGVSLNDNKYVDILQLIIIAPAVLYIIMYFSKHIEKSICGKFFAYVGKESFYIMALHFIGFKMCSLMLIGFSIPRNLSQLSPIIGSNVVLLILYAILGVGFPLLFMFCFRIVKRRLLGM